MCVCVGDDGVVDVLREAGPHAVVGGTEPVVSDVHLGKVALHGARAATLGLD